MFVLKAAVTEKSNAKSIFLFDTSGIYASDNVTGWGSPNPAIADATSAVIRIYYPDSTTLLPQTTYEEIDVFNDLPNTSDTPYEITATSQGLTTFIDGWYIFKYIVVADGDTYTATVQQIFVADVCCCVKNTLQDTSFSDCGCGESSSLNKSNKMWAMFRSIDFLRLCYKQRRAIEKLKQLKRLCADCATCP